MKPNKKHREIYFIEDDFSDEKTIWFENRNDARKEFYNRGHSGVRFGFAHLGKHKEIIHSGIIAEH